MMKENGTSQYLIVIFGGILFFSFFIYKLFNPIKPDWTEYNKNKDCCFEQFLNCEFEGVVIDKHNWHVSGNATYAETRIKKSIYLPNCCERFLPVKGNIVHVHFNKDLYDKIKINGKMRKVKGSSLIEYSDKDKQIMIQRFPDGTVVSPSPPRVP